MTYQEKKMEILDTYRGQIFDAIEGVVLKKSLTLDEGAKKASAATVEASHAIDELVKEYIIGGSEDVTGRCKDLYCSHCDDAVIDDLRASQRQVIDTNKKEINHGNE